MGTRQCGDRGAAAVEFALVVPLLFALLLGIVDFGFVFNAKIAMTNAAAEGARVVALGGSPDEAEARVVTALAGSGQLLDLDIDPSGCSGPDPTGSSASVTVEGTVHTILPLPDIDLEARGVMACTG